MSSHAGGHGHAGGHEQHHEHGPDHGPRWLCRAHALGGVAVTLFLLVHFGIGLAAFSGRAYSHVISAFRASPVVHGLSLALVALVAAQLATGVARLLRGGLRGGCSHGAFGPLPQRITAMIVASFILAHIAYAAFLGPLQGPTALQGAARLVAGAAGGVGARVVIDLLTLTSVGALAFHVGNGWFGVGRFAPFAFAQPSSPSWGRACAALGVAVGLAGALAWLAVALPAAR